MNEPIAIAEVVLIDITLAADNAVIVGLAGSRVAPELRARAVFWGITGAVLLRVAFAGVITRIMSIIGLRLAGGLLLLWVCWKMFREFRATPASDASAGPSTPSTGLGPAVVRMIIADLSVSLDNVLAVAGAARDSALVLALGLAVSVTLMAIASSLVAKLVSRFPWVAWIGLTIVVYVALDMIWRGFVEIRPHAFG